MLSRSSLSSFRNEFIKDNIDKVLALINQSGRTLVLEEVMTSRFFCFARKSQKINARKYGLSKKLDSRFHRSISKNFKASLGLVYTSDGSDGSGVVSGVGIGRKF